VSYAYGQAESGFFNGVLLSDGQSVIVILKIYNVCPLTPLDPKTWKPFLTLFPFWKNCRAAPGLNLSKSVSVNDRGAACFLGLSKLRAWGLSPIFGNFLKT